MKRWMGVLAVWIAAGALGLGYLAWHGRSAGAGAAAPVEAKKTYYTCAMHPQYISDKPGNCPICGMQLVAMDKHAGEDAHDARSGAKGVRIDPATMQNMGVKTGRVEKRDLRAAIRTSGKVRVDETRLAILNARVMGYVEKLHADYTGQRIVRGQSLLELYSPDLVSTQEEYLQAVRYAAAMEGNAGARELVESSRRRLLNWGISEKEIESLRSRGSVDNTMSIISPVNGVVLEKAVVLGQSVAPGMELYKIADLSKVWVVASVYQGDLALAKVGADAEVELSYLPGKVFRGKVTFVSPVLDEQTRTADVRIEVANTPSLDLKPEMFATVRIQAPPIRDVVAVPEQSIIRSGKRNIAIVAMGGGYFEPREVSLGLSADGYVQVLDGLHEGESLVISSQFLIDSESNLKAAIQQMQASPAGAER